MDNSVVIRGKGVGVNSDRKRLDLGCGTHNTI